MRLSGLFTLLFWSFFACFVIASVLEFAGISLSWLRPGIAGYALLFSFLSLALSATLGLREACHDLDRIRADEPLFIKSRRLETGRRSLDGDV